ncbi:hypothetical protein [Bacillus thuringiensis]|uniref:hypothetical protein n=1 Tax=Bacillus thuringiensis TaxID=1428 RepID=UPI00159BE482|nr:hypothetical protein [Bacillus thuringiensis]
MEQAKKVLVEIDEKQEASLSELLREFNPTIEEHIKAVDDQVSEVLMGRCPPVIKPT